MAETQYNADYLLDSDQEPLRLERQALIYGFHDDLRHLSLSPGDHVLDAGCGSGSITREIARSVPNGSATGIDREPKYIDFARRKAAAQGIANVRFEVGDATSLPFEKGRFDVVWSKHLLQWVKDQSVVGFSAKVFGSLQRAEQFRDRLVERFNRADVYLFCPLFYVAGRVE